MRCERMREKPLAENGTTVPREGETVHPGGQTVAPKKSRQKSAVSNGTQLLVGVKNTNAWARRCRDVLSEHLSDLGGEDNTSAAERSLIRRAAVLTTELEMLESQFALGGKADVAALDVYVRGAGGLRRLLQTVGIDRKTKPVEGVFSYIARKYPKTEEPPPSSTTEHDGEALMQPLISLSEAINDVTLLGGPFTAASFWTWRVVAKLIDGVRLTEPREIALFEACDRPRLLPTKPSRGASSYPALRSSGWERSFPSARVAVWRAALGSGLEGTHQRR